MSMLFSWINSICECTTNAKINSSIDVYIECNIKIYTNQIVNPTGKIDCDISFIKNCIVRVITGWVKYPDALHRLTYTTCNLKNAGREARNSRHTPELCSGWVKEFQAFLLILF